MYCTSCGTQMEAAQRFCGNCGKAAGGPMPVYPVQMTPLARDMANKKIAGVCAGIARHLGWDVTLVRVGFLLAFVFHGFGLVGYMIAWICMPRDDIRSYATNP